MIDILVIIWLHFFGDFILQSDRLAINKSKNNLILLEHVTLYSLPFLYFGIEYAIINAALHFVIDWCTSRTTSYFWQRDLRHWFFVTIGFDQALHLTCLITTYIWLI